MHHLCIILRRNRRGPLLCLGRRRCLLALLLGLVFNKHLWQTRLLALLRQQDGPHVTPLAAGPVVECSVKCAGGKSRV